MKIGGFAIVVLAGAFIAAAPAQAKRPSYRPAYAPPPAAPVYVAPAAPVRSAPVWGADGYRFDPPAGAAPFAPSPYGY
ncbi:hypothetical protein IY145_07000 [Methylosinus sp. H3A]|uniref:hypothetical protein n=1 Tax=Methylosinus sp. H3A TaxID=2785786 RepID=UPI0018C1F23E|nr:hypothetical protein [Methylosinus sp. H3A]MBG0809121.1 hypothetical protein [Methylosinus sp. H3A]